MPKRIVLSNRTPPAFLGGFPQKDATIEQRAIIAATRPLRALEYQVARGALIDVTSLRFRRRR